MMDLLELLLLFLIIKGINIYIYIYIFKVKIHFSFLKFDIRFSSFIYIKLQFDS